jgi:MFS family permease
MRLLFVETSRLIAKYALSSVKSITPLKTSSHTPLSTPFRSFLQSFLLRSTVQNQDKRVLVLVFCRGITALGFSVVFPFLSIYLHNVMRVSMTAIGTVFLASSLAGALSALVGGELSDKFGRKRVMVLALIFRAITFFLIGLAVLKSAGFLVIAALVVVSSFAGRLFEPAAGAMISDVTAPAKRQEAYALLRIGINLGWAIGPAIGGFLASFSYAFLFFASAIVISIGLVVLLVALKGYRTAGHGERVNLRDLASVGRDKAFVSYNLVSLLLFLVMAQLMMTLSVYAVDWVGISKIQLGYLYTVNGLMVVFLQFPCVRLVRGLRMTRVMALGSFLYAAGYFSAAFAGGFIALLLSVIVVTFGEMFTSPPSLALVSNMAPRERYGRYMGVFELFGSVGHSLGPFVGGIIMDASAGNRLVLWGFVGIIGLIATQGFLVIGNRLAPGVDSPVREVSPSAMTAVPVDS